MLPANVIKLRKLPSNPSILRVFHMNVYWSLSNVFLYILRSYVFISFVLLMLNYVVWFLNAKPPLYSENKLHFVKCIILYLYCCIFSSLIVSTFKFLFLKSLSTVHHRDIVLLLISNALITLLLYVEFQSGIHIHMWC